MRGSISQEPVGNDDFAASIPTAVSPALRMTTARAAPKKPSHWRGAPQSPSSCEEGTLVGGTGTPPDRPRAIFAEWPEFVANYAPWWATHTLDWLRYGRKVLVVHFEDLKRDLFAQLKRMVGLLGIAACEDRLLCVEGQKDGNFKRSGLRKLEYDPYTPEMRKMISGYIKTVDAALKLRNLSGVPEDYYPR